MGIEPTAEPSVPSPLDSAHRPADSAPDRRLRGHQPDRWDCRERSPLGRGCRRCPYCSGPHSEYLDTGLRLAVLGRTTSSAGRRQRHALPVTASSGSDERSGRQDDPATKQRRPNGDGDRRYPPSCACSPRQVHLSQTHRRIVIPEVRKPGVDKKVHSTHKENGQSDADAHRCECPHWHAPPLRSDILGTIRDVEVLKVEEIDREPQDVRADGNS